MGVFKNGVGRPSNETIKKRNIFKGICVLLVLIIIGMTVYILNDKGIINISGKDNKKTVDKKTDKDTTKESKKEKLDLDTANEIMDEYLNAWRYMLDSDYNDINSDEYKTLISLQNSKNSDFSDKYNYEDRTINFNNEKFYDPHFYEIKNVEKTFNKRFKNGKVSTNIEKINKMPFSNRYGYDSKYEIFIRDSLGEFGDASILMHEITEAYEDENNVYVSVTGEKVYLEDTSYNPRAYIILNNNEKIFIDYDADKIMIIEKYKDNMDKYEFVFEKNGDYYKFVNVSKIK